MVASPTVPSGIIGGIQNLMTVSSFLRENGRRSWTIAGSKCFMALILLAAAGSAKIMVMGDNGSSWRNVAS